MTIEKLVKHINHEITCHQNELDVIIAEKKEDNSNTPIEESVSIITRGIQLKAKIDQLKLVLVLCGEDVKGMTKLVNREE